MFFKGAAKAHWKQPITKAKNRMIGVFFMGLQLGLNMDDYFKSMKGTVLPSMYCGNLPSHFCTAS